MGSQSKVLLSLNWHTFLSRLEKKLSVFEKKLISLQNDSWFKESTFSSVLDQEAGRKTAFSVRHSLQTMPPRH